MNRFFFLRSIICSGSHVLYAKTVTNRLHVNTVGVAVHACVSGLHVRRCMFVSVERIDEFTANPRCLSPPGGDFSSLHVHKYMSTQEAYLSVPELRLTGTQSNNLPARGD